MMKVLPFDDLQAIFPQRLEHLPAQRQPRPNTRYTRQDAVLGALGLFFTHSPAFLASQRHRQHTQGHNNAQTLCGVAQMPCDKQVRTLLDPRAPRHLEPVVVEICKGLEQHRMFDHCRGLGDQLLL